MSLSDFGTKKMAEPRSVLVSKNQSPRRSDDEEEKIFVQWGLVGDNTYRIEGKTYNKIPSAFYVIDYDRNTMRKVFKKLNVETDTLIHTSNDIEKKILDEINDFWSKEDVFRKHGFLHYRGYLLYGAHGSGKTCLVQMIAQDVISRGGVVIVCKDPDLFVSGIQELRSVEPDRPIVCLFEDLEAMIRSHDEEEILSYLDGEQKINKVLNIATTNYPELLDKRLVSRPRRFDRVIKIDYPDEKSRRTYLLKKIDKDEVAAWTKATDGFSFASLAELVIRVKCLDYPFEKAVKELRDFQEKEVSSTDGNGKVGFEGKTE